MDKPKSLSVKDFLIRKMSVKLLIPEYTIEAIVTHQFQEALKAMIANKSVEISGFGKFIFNEKRALKKLEKFYSLRQEYENTLASNCSPQKIEGVKTRMKNLTADIEKLTTILNVHIRNN